MSYIHIPEIGGNCIWVSDEIPENAELVTYGSAGAGWNKGIPHTLEQKRKMSEVRKGKVQSKETIQKRLNARTDHSQREETKKKISNTLKGRIFSEEHKLNLRKAKKNARCIS